MLTIGIDTATRVCSVAVVDEGKVLASLDVNVGLTHSEGLVPQLETLLTMARVDKKAVQLIAVSRGPGSFTGLRIGMATAEALAYSLDVPLQAVDTLQAIACNLPVQGVRLIPVLDAQKGNLYVGQYAWDGQKIIETAPVSIVLASDLEQELAKDPIPAVILGECKRLTLSGNTTVTLAPLAARLPRASSVAILGEASYKPGPVHAYFGLEPFYIRRSEAEELWEKRQKKQS